MGRFAEPSDDMPDAVERRLSGDLKGSGYTRSHPQSILGGRASGSTRWQALQASRAKACPVQTSPSCAFGPQADAANAAPNITPYPIWPIVTPPWAACDR